MKYWLMKSEPDAFSIDDLRTCPKKTDHWDGIRNYQARNFMLDDMSVGDQVFFYHSNCDEPGVVGIMEVVRAAYPDHTALDPDSRYHDPKSTPDENRWMMVDVKYKKKFKQPVSLKQLKTDSRLSDMRLVQKGNRLSVMPVTAREWKIICNLAD